MNTSDKEPVPRPDQPKPYIERFGPHELAEDDTDRAGFLVEDPGARLSYARCYEGYVVGHGSNEVIEPSVLDLDMVSVSGASIDQGVGTRLIRHALDEGREQGFPWARATVENPRIIHILSKLEEEGTIAGTKYAIFPEDSDPVPTQEVVEDVEPVSTVAASAYLNSLPQDEDGMLAGSHDRLEVVIALTSYPVGPQID